MLDDLVARVEAGEIAAEDAAQQAPLHRGESVAVTIQLTGNVDDVVNFLEANGASNIASGDDYIEAYVPVLLLAETSKRPGVVRIRPIQPPEESQGGSGIPGNGPAVHGSTAWNQAGYTGSGIKVGVIDGGFAGFAGLMGSEVPATVQRRCYSSLGAHSDNLEDCERRTDHGTRVAESLIDIAPDVTLYIADPPTRSDLKNTVDWMISEGVSVINFSMGWLFDGPGDGTSPSSISPLNVVDRAVASGIVWVSSAGNHGRQTWFKRGPFSYSTITIGGEETRVINFEGSTFTNRFHLSGPLQLRWGDTWGGATSDLDLLLVRSGETEIALASIDPQSGEVGHNPYEVVRPDPFRHGLTYFNVMVAHNSGREPDWIQLLGWGWAGLLINTRDAGIANPAESANPGMLAVGAASWQSILIGSYSSRGPTPDGRIKPDLVGADCGETSASEKQFCGTSQASPHIAGLAALVRQRFPSYTPAQVVSYLTENAEQQESPDPNNTWGHGFVVLPAPPALRIGSPSIQSTTPGADSLTVAWSAPSGDGGSTVTAYDLRHIETSADETVDANWIVVEDVWTSGSGALSYEVTGLTGGTQYDVQVRAVSSAGDGSWSATVTGTTTGTVALPGAPTGLTATATGQTQIDLSWTAPSSDGGPAITGYRIEVSEDGSTWTDLVANTGSTSMSYSHTGLTAGNARHYRVSAINPTGTGNASNIANATTGVAPTPDLVVDTLTVDTSAPAAGASFTLSATVRNQGSGRSDSTTLRYYQSTDSTITTGDTEVGTDPVGGLDPSESERESISLTAPDAAGTYYYGACVEVVTDESETTNNCSGAVAVAVGAAPAPDLVVDTLTVSESAPAAGAPFTLNATVRNQGNGASVLAILRFYQSTDSTITTGDTELGTDPVGGLDPSESERESISLTAPDAAGIYFYGACVEAVTSESDTTNNCSLAVIVTVGAAPAPDLVVDTPTVDASATTAGASFTLSATVRNQGNGRSDSTTLRYYQSTDATIDTSDTEVGTDSITSLDASDSGDESIGLTAPGSPGTYYYGACVDGVSGESDASNNCSASVTVTVGAAPAPDLVVDAPTVDTSAPAAGARITLSATVRNQGNGRSDSTTLRYYESTDATITTGDTEIDTDYVSRLGPSESGDESVRLTAPSTPGTYYLGVCVDAVPGELDTTNNCSVAVAVTVGAAPAPDLVVDAPTVSESAPAAGARVTLSATVRNQGNGRSDSTTLRYYRSTDSTITASDTEVGTDSVFRLDASESGDESVRLTAPSTPGTYYLGACVDAVPGELDTTNNCSPAVTVTVGAAPAPDLVVDTPVLSNANPVPGASFPLSVTVRNQGNGEAGPTTLRYYRSTDSTITTADISVGTSSVGRLPASDASVVSTVLPGLPAIGTYYFGACVDVVSGESDTTNNCSSAAMVTVAAPSSSPDLVVDMGGGTGTSVAGTSFNINLAVRNQAAGATSASTTLRYYRSTDALITVGDTEVGTGTVGPLGGSNSYSRHSIDLIAPSSKGTYYYGACVDAVPGESDTTNNCSSARTITIDALGPDLVVTQVNVPAADPIAGEDFWISVHVENQGDSRALSPTARFYRSTDATISTGDTEIGMVRLRHMEASQRFDGGDIRTLEVAPLTAGTYYYGACLDPVDGESDKTNNCSSAESVTVVSASGADLVIESFEIPEVYFPTLPMYARVRNQGTGVAAKTPVSFYRSTDATISTSDTRIDGQYVRRLAPSETGTAQVTTTAETFPGTYYYGACVDPVSGESDTTNNCSAAVAVTVGGAPASVPGAPTGLIANADGQTQIDLSWTAPSDDGGAVITGYRIEVSTDGSSWSDLVADTGSTGTTYSHTGLTAGSTRHYRVSAINSAGTGTASNAANATTGSQANRAPRAVGSIPEQVITQGVQVTIDVSPYFDDPDGDDLTYAVDSPSLFNQLSVSGSTVTMRNDFLLCDPTTVTVTAQDGGGLEAAQRFTVRRSNSPPVASSGTFPAQTIDVGESSPLYMGNWFSDPDACDSRLIYTAASSDATKVTASASGNNVTVAGVSAGAATVTVTAQDTGGLEATLDIQVTVTTTAPASAPDLVVDTPTVSESAPAVGAQFTLNATVRNQGSSSSDPTTLRYYQSTDSAITAGDTEVGTDSVSGLGASGSGDESTSLTAPSEPGTYYYGACVDAASDESDTTNNCSLAVAVTVTVGAAPGNPANQRYSWEGSTIVVSWDSVPEAEYYKIYYSDFFESNCRLVSGRPSFCE